MNWRKQLKNCVCGLPTPAQLKSLSSLFKVIPLKMTYYPELGTVDIYAQDIQKMQ